MKHNFRKAALSTICMLIVAVMSLTGVTYAWFTAGETATVNGMQMQVTAADGGVQVSAWKNNAWTNWASTVTLGSTMENVKPVSSIDGQNFFIIDTNDDDSTKAKIMKVTNEDTNYYMSNRIKLKNPGTEDITVSLSANTTLSDATFDGAVTTDIKDAARIAIIVTDVDGNVLQAGTNANKTYIWAASDDDNYFGLNAEGTDVDLDGNGFVPSTATSNGESVTITSGSGCDINLPKMVKGENGASVETEVFVTIVVWIEGQDANCVNYNAGGSFDVQIQFAVE